MARHNENIIKKIKAKLSRGDIDALLLSRESNIKYIFGYCFTGTIVLVPKKGRPFYFVNAMNRTLAEKLFHGLRLNTVSHSGAVTECLARCIKDGKMRKIGVNTGNLPVSVYDRILKLVPETKLMSSIDGVPTGAVMEDLRKIKSQGEIRILREAAKETVRIWRTVKKKISTGMSEQDIAAMVDICLRSRGYQNSFPTIAAIGENTAFPHAIPGSRRLSRGEHLLVDFGIRFHGYCSDLTRIYDNGRINGQIRGLRSSVYKALDFAAGKIKPGVRVASLVKGINSIFKREKFEDFILHGLGHGVGVDVHERPFLGAGCRGSLRKGMVITVEPGLYKPGIGGIRKEDMVLVTAKGCEVLTR